jgi:homoserine dehydrogenase
MGGRSQIGIVLLGFGVVGSGVAGALLERSDSFARRVGLPLTLRRVLVRDVTRDRSVGLPEGLLTDNAEEALATECDIVVEVMGGEQPALDYITHSLAAGRRVVTANKEVMAKHGAKLLALAHESGGDIFYEASVGGGIPIISPLKRDLSANEITSVRAIINGTTNYILTQMSLGGVDFASALMRAQDLGYAETQPANDIEGHDAAYKLAILASLAFHTDLHPDQVYREGITRLTPRDFRYAAELGYAIKLLAIARRDSDGVEARVHPVLLPQWELLAKVDGVLNAVQVEGDLTGRVLFQGAGAGALPTTSAIMADVLDAARSIAQEGHPSPWRYTSDVPVKPMSDLLSRYYIRVEVSDRPGVLAGIGSAFGDNGVSIASVIQKETDEEAQTAEIVIMTHAAREASIQASIARLDGLEIVRQVGNFLRVED